MNNISARDSLPGRCLVCSDGINRWASQSANALQKSSRQQYSAVISTAIERTIRNRVCGSVFANRSCQTFDSFGIPSTLIRSSGYFGILPLQQGGEGRIVSPDGKVFVPRGVNVMQGQEPSLSALHANFPGINFVRYANYQF